MSYITSSRKVGANEATLQPASYGRGQNGRFSVISWESVNADKIDAIAYTCESLGLQYEVRHNFGKSRIEIHYTWNFAQGADPATEMIEKWELIPLKVEKSILDTWNNLTRRIIAAGNSNQLLLIKRFLEKGNLDDLVDIDPDTGDVSFTPPAGVSDNRAILLLKYWFDGQRTQAFSVPVVKHVKTVNSQYLYRVGVPSFPTLYSTPDFIATFNIPNSLLWNMPTNDMDLITTPIPGNLGGIYQTFGFGWLRSAPEVSQIANYKWTISEEFQYGLWGLDLFDI